MKDRLHIRNAEAAQLARMLARQTGKTITDVVLDALRQYRSRLGESSLPPLPTFQSGGLLVDIADRDALYKSMEGR